MRFSRPLLVASALALAAGVAVAEKPIVHVMKVALPDGSVEEVHYVGNTPPRVVVADAGDPLAGFMGAGMMPGFADLDRVSAAMDAQMAAMMRHAQAMQQAAFAQGGSNGGGMQMTGAQATGAMPAGTQFSYVSSSTVNGKTCTTSVRQIAGQNGAAPQMLRQVSGDGCSAAVKQQQGLIPTAAPAPAKAPVAPTPVAAPAAPKAPANLHDTI